MSNLFRRIVEQFFVDATGKATDEDKYSLYESSKADSGFISGEISEEITDSGIISEDKTKKSSDKRDEKKGAEAHMLIDSGVCLVEDFSKISLNKGLNDLNTSNKVPQPPVAKIKPTDPDEIPWKLYYEQNEDGDTHLHLAIAEGYVEVALALIRAAPYPRLLDTPNDDDQTPLHLAVETSQWKIARWLVVSGAQPCSRDIRGDSPLHIAARTNDCMSVQAIADPVKQQERDELALSYQGYPYRPCDFDQWNYLGQTCVHVAALHGNVQVLRHLVWFGANVNARDGCSGYAALHYAVQRRDEHLVHFLLQYQGVDMKTVTYGGKTALEVNPGVSPTMRAALRNRGVPTPYPSDDEDEEESEDEMMYENTRLFSAPMVNASA